MSKHTPFPWRLDARPGCVAVYDGEERNCLDAPTHTFIFFRMGIQEPDPVGWKVAERDIADAKLISKIPKMIATLQAIANDRHCQYDQVEDGTYGTGVADGHRCAAKKARAILKEIEE